MWRLEYGPFQPLFLLLISMQQIDNLGMSVYCFNDHMASMKTGDAILFAGGSRLSAVIKKGSNSPVSHIGFILRMPDPRNGNKEEIFVVESDQLPEGDHFTDAKCDGKLCSLCSSAICSFTA